MQSVAVGRASRRLMPISTPQASQIAVVVLLDALYGGVDFLDQLALAIPGAQFQAELFFLGGAICRVGEVCRLILHMA